MTQSNETRLHGHRLAFEDQHVASILHRVEHRCRIMCRMMQVFREEGTDNGMAGLERDWEDRGDAITVFYEYIDQQMNTLAALREGLDRGPHFTINNLNEEAAQ